MSDNPSLLRARPRLRFLFGAGFAVAATITALAVFLTTAAPASPFLAATGDLVLVVLALNLLLIVALAAVVGLRVWGLVAPSARADAGMRLHRRFVGLFAMAAVAPAIIVALFFGLLVTRGVENWFSSRVRTVVENAATLARSYVKEQVAFIESRVPPMAEDLNRYRQVFDHSRILFSNYLAEQAFARDFIAVYVIDSGGRVLARGEGPTAPRYLAPPAKTLRAAANEVQFRFDDADMARAVFKLKDYPDAYLYAVRPLGSGIMGQLRRSEAAVVNYREADNNRGRIQTIFILSYFGTALLVLTGAVWVGMTAATQIATPVARLVQAADRVAGGDLDARVETEHDPEEIAVLSRAFNRMTGDLQAQQRALRAAGEDAESRRRIIEAVLSGVSA
ncbi:MAG: HAMP domain-containing protein, partial [Caulobacteraceae bacterium]